MPTSAPGSSPRTLRRRGRTRAAPAGFTLLELLVVVAIIAIASAGVSFAVRDAAGANLDREAQRLAALLEAGRAQSRLAGQPVVWRAVDGAFRFEGLPPDALPQLFLAPPRNPESLKAAHEWAQANNVALLPTAVCNDDLLALARDALAAHVQAH